MVHVSAYMVDATKLPNQASLRFVQSSCVRSDIVAMRRSTLSIDQFWLNFWRFLLLIVDSSAQNWSFHEIVVARNGQFPSCPTMYSAQNCLLSVRSFVEDY